ncbi:hypothetical protein ACTPEF_26630, partial [Clostridioides difficile]
MNELNIAKTLILKRKEKGITQDELENLLDIEKDTIFQVPFSYTSVFCKQVNTGCFLISFCLGNSSF